MLSAIYQMTVLLLVAIVGYLAGKLGYLDRHTQGTMSKVVVNLCMPLLIVGSVGEMDLATVGPQVIPAFGLGVLLALLSIAAGYLCAALCRIPKDNRGAIVFCSMFSNLAFIGIAVAQSLFGEAAVLYVSIFIMCANLFTFSVGMAIMGGAHPSGLTPVGLLRSCVNPPMIACIVALLLLLSGAKLPGVAETALTTVGGVTAPMAMMLVGAIVANNPLKSVLVEWRLYPLSLLRQLVFPLLAWLALRNAGFDPTLLATFVAMFGMPVGAMAASMCEMRGVDGTLPARYTVISTLLSFATLPLLLGFVATVA